MLEICKFLQHDCSGGRATGFQVMKRGCGLVACQEGCVGVWGHACSDRHTWMMLQKNRSLWACTLAQSPFPLSSPYRPSGPKATKSQPPEAHEAGKKKISYMLRGFFGLKLKNIFKNWNLLGIQSSCYDEGVWKEHPKRVGNHSRFRWLHTSLFFLFCWWFWDPLPVKVGNLDPDFTPPNMGTHFSFIFRGYNIYNPYFWGLKAFIIHGFGGPKVVSCSEKKHLSSRSPKLTRPVNLGHPKRKPVFQASIFRYLVGGFNPSAKYARQIGSFPQIGMNTKNVWNHHLDAILVPGRVIRSFPAKPADGKKHVQTRTFWMHLGLSQRPKTNQKPIQRLHSSATRGGQKTSYMKGGPWNVGPIGDFLDYSLKKSAEARLFHT